MRRLACLVLVVVLVVVVLVVVALYCSFARTSVLKTSVDIILDQAVAEYLGSGAAPVVYDSFVGTLNTVANLCTALIGKKVLFVGPETTYYLHTLWLDALQAHTNRSLMCKGPQFCTFHHVCGSATPTYNGRTIKVPHQDELLATNSCIIRYVRSHTLHAADDANDRAYTRPIVDGSTGVRVHNAYWLRHARRADVIVLNHGPLPAPVSTYRDGGWTFGDQPVYVDGSPVVNAAVHATLREFLPATVRALHVLHSLQKQGVAVVWHGSWLMDAGCPGRKKRVMRDWLNSRWVGDPWTLYYNSQVYMQNRVMNVLMPELGGVFYKLELGEGKEGVGGKFAADCLLYGPRTRRGKEMQRVFLGGLERLIS